MPVWSSSAAAANRRRPAAGADEVPPTVTLTAPGNNATLSGVVTLTATASDDRGIAGVTFMIDSVALGAEDTEAPYTFTWNTLQGDNATHHIAAGARDLEGNGTTSSPVTGHGGESHHRFAPPRAQHRRAPISMLTATS